MASSTKPDTPQGGSKKAFAAIGSQGTAAAASLALQIIALWKLGDEGLGIFAILVAGVLVTYNAVHTGWIGDALTVFDRERPSMRWALIYSQLGSAVGALIIGFFCAIAFADRSPLSAGLFALALLAWTVEESGRRLFMARLEFNKLWLNDIVYAVASLGLAGAGILLDRISIDWLLASMLFGSIASTLLLRYQLPQSEFTLGPRERPEMRTLAKFSAWRAGQIGVRPASMLIVRLVIVGVTSEAALGNLEAGRLVLAPIFTAANGLGAFLLPTFTRRVDEPKETMTLVAKIAAGGALATLIYGVTMAFAVPPITSRLGDAGIIFAWTTYAMAYVANIPFANALVARKRSRDVFQARLVDGAVGIALGYILVLVFGVVAVPVGLAIGVACGSGWLLWWLYQSKDPALGLGGSAVRSREFAPVTSIITSFKSILGQPGAPVRMPPIFLNSWVAVLPIAMMLATEYKFRKRELSSALEGSVDFAILLEIGIYGLVAAYLVLYVAAPPVARRPTAIQFFTWAYVGSLCTTVLFSSYPALGAVRGAQLIVIAAYVHAVSTRATRRQMHMFAHAFVAVLTFSVPLGLVWREPFSDLQLDRFTWMNVHPVIAAAMLAIAVVISVAYLLRKVGLQETTFWPKSFYAASLAICTVGLIATKTRGSMAGAALGVLVVVYLSIRRTERLPAVAFGTLGLFVVGSFFGPTVLSFLTRGETTESITSLSNRTTLWSLAFDFWLEKPFMGWGLTASRGVFYDYVGLGGAHNAYINVLVDGGIITTFFWVGMLVTIGLALRMLWQSNTEIDSPMLSGILVAMLLNGMTTEGMGSGSGVSAMWLLIIGGWLGVLQRRKAQVERLSRAGLKVGADSAEPTEVIAIDDYLPVVEIVDSTSNTHEGIGDSSQN